MSITNHVQLIGHIGNQPEVKTTSTGKQIVKFSLATHESYKNEAGVKVTTSDWHNIIGFGQIAELAGKYLKSGSHVLIIGKVVTRSYDATPTDKKYVTEIIIDSIHFLDKKD